MIRTSLRCQHVLLKWIEWKNETAAVEAVMTLLEPHSCPAFTRKKSKEIMKSLLKDVNYSHYVGLKGLKLSSVGVHTVWSGCTGSTCMGSRVWKRCLLKSSLQLLQLFWRMLQQCFPVKLQTCLWIVKLGWNGKLSNVKNVGKR